MTPAVSSRLCRLRTDDPKLARRGRAVRRRDPRAARRPPAQGARAGAGGFARLRRPQPAARRRAEGSRVLPLRLHAPPRGSVRGRLHGRLLVRLADRLQRGGPHPEGSRCAHRGPRRADRRGHRRLRFDALLSAADAERAQPGLTGGVRAAHEARETQGRAADQVRGVRDPEPVRHRLRARPRGAFPQSPLRRGAAGVAPGWKKGARRSIHPWYPDVSPGTGPVLSRFFKSAAFPILIVVVLAFFSQNLISPGQQQRDPVYSTFLSQVERGQVKSVTLNTKNNRVDVQLNGGRKYQTAYPDNTEQNLVNTLRSEDIPIDVKAKGGSGWLTALTYILPFVIFLLFWLFIINQMQGGGSKVMSFGKSRAKRMSVDSPKITFRDVAGVDEAVEELQEIKEFLENPKKFQALGARIPKGVLLYGPPGTGKTLLARAVAGEAGGPFFSISGSDFVEMFVGVGASRVRDLFEPAKQNSPCIIFMDEIDAVGRHRGAGLGGAHGDREQTPTQLLPEMDVCAAAGKFMMSPATNWPAPLRPDLSRP